MERVIEITQEQARDIRVLELWMHKYAERKCNAKKKDAILPFVRFEERYFRQLVALSPYIFSTPDDGYWIVPLVDESGLETRYALDSLGGERRRAIKIHIKIRHKRRAIYELFSKSKQLVLFGGVNNG